MVERCPLSGGGHAIEGLPDVCMRNCSELWEAALASQVGDMDVYGDPFGADSDGCNHVPIVMSHEALQAVDGTSKRVYSIVDMCEDCEKELYETDYTFHCPHNDLPKTGDFL